MRSMDLSVKLQADAKKLLLIRAGFHRSIQESGYEHEQVRNTARTRNPRTDLCEEEQKAYQNRGRRGKLP